MSPGPARGRTPGQEGGSGRRSPVRRWQLVRAGADAVPPSTRRFMARARQRRMRAALPWAVAAAVAAVGGLVAWTVLGTGLFGVRDVRVVGARTVTPVEIRDAAAVPDNAPLARVDLAATARRVGALPPVARAAVERDWPGTLVIRVEERVAVAAVPQGERFAVIDGSGVVFQHLDQAPAGMPLVRVARPGPDDPGTRAGLAVLAALGPKLRAELVAVDVAGLARITLLLRGDREVFWGDASRGPDKSTVATALLGRRADRIDVSAPDVVTFQ
ncbi:FtsQ-type POTRA domain-containing protein [Micromonospora sp. WMMA1998]|uniref:cell division protein FtsQ/DivIB n=1 Tax=Micromonospora sp. WMMA1998 TaxID=3015167 RepID=UPI00248C640C|nr:FtsQ-type POTRA domain-containing protein [Micromonospora sp. WMMA1998]WBC17060.1 FtsQ-type POTRA domain-containing protein [Micromonospora sp. WMMA1998]